jgi:hypothetical protein
MDALSINRRRWNEAGWLICKATQVTRPKQSIAPQTFIRYILEAVQSTAPHADVEIMAQPITIDLLARICNVTAEADMSIVQPHSSTQLTTR